MTRKTALASLVATLVAFTLVLTAIFAGGATSTKTATAETITNLRYVTIAANNGTTATTVLGTGVDTQYYGSADCFSTYVAGTAVAGASFTTATVALQTSLDNTNWATVLTFAAQITPSTLYTRTPLYGTYTRASVTAGNTNAVTTTVKCKLLQNYQ